MQCELHYLVEEVGPSHSSHFPSVVNQPFIPLCRSIHLNDLDGSKSMQELLPDLHFHAIADCHAHTVITVIAFLQRTRWSKESRLNEIHFMSSHTRRASRVCYEKIFCPAHMLIRLLQCTLQRITYNVS